MADAKTTKAKTRKSRPAKRKKESSKKIPLPAASAPAEASSTRPGRLPVKKDHVLAVVAKNPSWNAQQVAEAAGCTPNYVYSVWGKPKRQRATKGSSSGAGGATDTEFYRVLKRVGVARAKELIANIEAYESA